MNVRYSYLYMILPLPTSTLFPYTTLFRSALFIANIRKTKLGLNRARLLELDHGGYLWQAQEAGRGSRSEEHTSELQSLRHLVCRLLLEKKKNHKLIKTILTQMSHTKRQVV